MRTVLATLHSKYIHNSLALPCLAAYCAGDCGELLIREFTVHEPRDTVLALLLAEQADVIGFSVYLWNRRETLDLVDAISVARPATRVVLGGPEVSFDGCELLNQHPGITALVRGEGEVPLKSLLAAWQLNASPRQNPNTLLRCDDALVEGPSQPPLADLDRIPSPFRRELADLQRGIVYYETGRGCPFHCSFCLSARDNLLRSYSMTRIRADLARLMEQQVAQVKLVDRTFNYDAERAREIFRFILAHNRATHFHFEIAGHLLDEETLELLREVPRGTFQFEIGVQSTLDAVLAAVDRRVNLVKLEQNIRRLRRDDRIQLHLDLVAGLPGEDFTHFLASIDRVAALAPHHLQIEPVKLLPGSPLREQAAQHGIRFDPNPPYTILASKELSYGDVQRLQGISRLLDLTYNSGCFDTFLKGLAGIYGSLAEGLCWLESEWRSRKLFRHPLSRRVLFETLAEVIGQSAPERSRKRLSECLARDYALCERVVMNRVPVFFDTQLSAEQRRWVDDRVERKLSEIRGAGVKLQHFACVFSTLDDSAERIPRLYFYLTGSGRRMRVEEHAM
jgi:anaerobic magnesium-protoporphyrin IX monomethyl ester cyclase